MDANADWYLSLQSFSWESAGRIALAALLGAIVGLERLWTGHPAGLRTNMVIAVSSCLFTILSIEAFPLQGSAQDTARVAAGIVTGVGFLGAGAMLQTKSHVRGLTTAATIWLVAALGMAVGAGVTPLAVFTTVLTTVSLVVLRPVSSGLARRARRQGTEQPDGGEGPTEEEDSFLD